MKKLVITIGCALAVTGAAFAQGNINWSGVSAAFMTAQTNSTTYSSLSPLFGGGAASSGITASIGNTVAGAGNWYGELLYLAGASQAPAPATLAALESWSDSGAEATGAASAGRWATVAGSAGFTVPWSAGTTDSIVMVLWSANLGSTWAAAEAALNNWASDPITGAFLGVSSSGYITTLATSVSPGSTVFGTATAQGTPIDSLLTQMYALQVPEPTTMALSGLGGLALLLIRRRK